MKLSAFQLAEQRAAHVIRKFNSRQELAVSRMLLKLRKQQQTQHLETTREVRARANEHVRKKFINLSSALDDARAEREVQRKRADRLETQLAHIQLQLIDYQLGKKKR